ncbi:hypothetical protein OGAPHI_002534 [Ogataea philodendri]|uniref:Uncharacterized protein n=1 Tax=Ogataea philodendri TaxID=1378263 RepID=A0A9P8T7T0_9ASCO|nr:uncharacterized protein OGAPHI_002534 [Ogataea philodendri]KAH3668779.1 hypothetical protein OGAPHI_002534 [Ogataea philodendri]
MAIPRAADLPRPLPAVKVTVVFRVFSAMESINRRMASAWFSVLAKLTSEPAGWVSSRLDFNSTSSCSFSESSSSSFGGSLFTCLPPETGRTFSSSSRTKQFLQSERDSKNLSLNLATTSLCASVLYLEWISMVTVYNCFKEDIDFKSITTSPPPSTVSIVLAIKLGVSPSKSCKMHIP